MVVLMLFFTCYIPRGILQNCSKLKATLLFFSSITDSSYNVLFSLRIPIAFLAVCVIWKLAPEPLAVM